MTISGRITPARICVVPFTAASSPSCDASSVERPLRHRDLAEPFGDDDREPDLLGAGNRDAEVVAEQRLEIRHRPCPPETIAATPTARARSMASERHARAADDDAAFHDPA